MARLEFDYEEYFNMMFKTASVLMWSSHIESYTFAFYLNQLYNLGLERCDNIEVGIGKSSSAECKLYSYVSNVKHMGYFLIDNGFDGKVNIFDKALLFYGHDARSEAEHMFGEMDAARVSDGEDRHAVMLQQFKDSGILESAVFDFSDPSNLWTSYFPRSASQQQLKIKQRFLKDQRTYACNLLLSLDAMLPDFDVID